jgi:acetyl coenzyme A synthetase (ADP forming)-like protein
MYGQIRTHDRGGWLMVDLSPLFNPERVAVIGATDSEGTVGRALLENLSRFEGEILPVNPKRESVLGMDCYSDVAEVPNPKTVDLAVVIVPASIVTDVVADAGEVGIENVVVISAGFSETGAEGEEREQELIDVAERYDLNLVGPNCVGIISTSANLNATFVSANPQPGSISMMSQSGAFIAAVLAWASQQGIGFNDVVSLGNEADIDEIAMIEEWAEDPDTDVILAYLEDIDDGRAFIEAARDLTEDTPMVVIKSGQTEAGAEAVASHTGSIAGATEGYRAAFHQAGVIEAKSVEEAFDYSRALAGQPSLETDSVAVLTNGGGPGVLAADAVERSHLELANYEKRVRNGLRDLLPPTADVGNPLDIIGDADIERFRESLDLVLSDGSVSGAVVLSVTTILFDFDELAEVVTDLRAKHDKPVFACLMGGEDADQAAECLAEEGIPTYFDPSRAVNGLEALGTQRAIGGRRYNGPQEFEVDRDRAQKILDKAINGDGGYLGVEGMDLLDTYGIPTPEGGLAESADDAEAIADSIGGSVVMKLVSPDIVHKSDIGGVEVDVKPADVSAMYDTLVERANAHNPDARLLGVRVEAFVTSDEQTETIVGVKWDPQFGHLLMFGLGGIFVEIFEDTSFRVVPVSEAEARDMTGEIESAPMLRGARGRIPADLDAVVETIQRVSQLVTDFPAIRELDINPLLVSPDGVKAVDLRLTVADEELTESP